MKTEIATIVMDTEEAQAWKQKVGAAARELRVLLHDGYQQQAWLALGYPSWNQCLMALADEFGFSPRHVQRLDNANKTQSALEAGGDYVNYQLVVNIIPESQLRPLSRLATDDEKREAWRAAKEAVLICDILPTCSK